jgi:hypothetical protein
MKSRGAYGTRLYVVLLREESVNRQLCSIDIMASRRRIQLCVCSHQACMNLIDWVGPHPSLVPCDATNLSLSHWSEVADYDSEFA